MSGPTRGPTSPTFTPGGWLDPKEERESITREEISGDDEYTKKRSGAAGPKVGRGKVLIKMACPTARISIYTKAEKAEDRGQRTEDRGQRTPISRRRTAQTASVSFRVDYGERNQMGMW